MHYKYDHVMLLPISLHVLPSLLLSVSSLAHLTVRLNINIVCLQYHMAL